MKNLTHASGIGIVIFLLSTAISQVSSQEMQTQSFDDFEIEIAVTSEELAKLEEVEKQFIDKLYASDLTEWEEDELEEQRNLALESALPLDKQQELANKRQMLTREQVEAAGKFHLQFPKFGWQFGESR